MLTRERTWCVHLTQLAEDKVIETPHSDCVFSPLQGHLGRVSIPFPNWNEKSISEWFSTREWYPKFTAYLDEMKHRKMRNFSFSDICLITDGDKLKDMSAGVYFNGKKMETVTLRPAEQSLFFLTTESCFYKEATGQTRAEAPEMDPWYLDVLNSRYYKNSQKLERHNSHVEHVEKYKDEYQTQGEQNSELLEQGHSVQASVLYGQVFTYGLNCEGANYMSSVVEIRIKHDGYVLGSVSFQMGLVAWLMSDYPLQNDSWDGPKLDIKWNVVTLDESQVKKVDPSFLGARFKVILRGFSKEIH